MDKEQVKNRIDFTKIREVEIEFKELAETRKYDYIYDSEDNNIVRLNPLEAKLIEKIKELEKRINDLERLAVSRE
jgi:hypothetical protein